MTDLKVENNDEIGHYGQTLIKNLYIVTSILNLISKYVIHKFNNKLG